jgi:hypothetical protein
MKDAPRQQFRNAAHVSGAATAKPKDCDLLESADGQLRICKYVGFEEARWVVPEATQTSFPAPLSEAPPVANQDMSPQAQA